MKNYILDNELLQDCISGNLYAIEDENSKSASTMVCKAVDNEGRKLQVHITVTYDETEFVDDSSEPLRTFNISEDNRLTL